MAKVPVEGLADSDGEVFPTLPTDTYEVRVKVMEVVDSKKYSDRKNFRASLVVMPTHPEFAGQSLFLYLPIPGGDMDATKRQQAAARIKNFCVACGLSTDLDDLETDDFMNVELRVVVQETEEEDPTTGKKRKGNNIRDYLPPSDD